MASNANRHRKSNAPRQGMTLMEVSVAAFIMVVITFGATSYYYYARWSQIRTYQEQAAMNLAEIEAERWRESGYSAFDGYSTPAALPYGYSYSATGGNQVAMPKYVTVDGISYRISASLLYNTFTAGSPNNNYRQVDMWGTVPSRYRRVIITVAYGNNYGTSVTLEARIGQ